MPSNSKAEIPRRPYPPKAGGRKGIPAKESEQITQLIPENVRLTVPDNKEVLLERLDQEEEEIFDNIEDLLQEAGYEGRVKLTVQAIPGYLSSAENTKQPEASNENKGILTVTLKRPRLVTGVSEADARNILRKLVSERVSQNTDVIIDVRAPQIKRHSSKAEESSRKNEVASAKALPIFSVLGPVLWEEYGLPKEEKRIIWSSEKNDFLEESSGEVVNGKIVPMLDELKSTAKGFAAGRSVLIFNKDGSLRLSSTELARDMNKEIGVSGDFLLEDLKLKAYPVTRGILKNIAGDIGLVQSVDDERIGSLARIVKHRIIDKLNDIESITKKTGSKGKARARTNMLGVVDLFNRLQKLGICDESGIINSEEVSVQLEDYLNGDLGKKANFIISLYNIGFTKKNRKRDFPVDELGLEKALENFVEEESPEEQVSRNKFLQGVHPDKGRSDHELRPYEPISKGNEVITAELAEFIANTSLIRKIENSLGYSKDIDITPVAGDVLPAHEKLGPEARKGLAAAIKAAQAPQPQTILPPDYLEQKKQLPKLRTSLVEAGSQADRLQRKLDELRDAQLKLAEEKQMLTVEFEKQKADATMAAKEASKNIDELKEVEKRLAEKNNQLNEKLKAELDKLHVLEKEHSEIKQNLHDTTEKLKDGSNTIADQIEIIRALKETEKALEEEINTGEVEVEKMKVVVRTLQNADAERAAMEEELRKTEVSTEKQLAQIQELTKKLNEAEKNGIDSHNAIRKQQEFNYDLASSLHPVALSLAESFKSEYSETERFDYQKQAAELLLNILSALDEKDSAKALKLVTQNLPEINQQKSEENTGTRIPSET